MLIKRDEYDALKREIETLKIYRRAWFADIINKTYSERTVAEDVDWVRGISSEHASGSGDRQYQVYEGTNMYADLAGILETRMKEELKEPVHEYLKEVYGPDVRKTLYQETLSRYIPRIVRLVYKAEEAKFNIDCYLPESAKRMKRLIKIYGGFRE